MAFSNKNGWGTKFYADVSKYELEKSILKSNVANTWKCLKKKLNESLAVFNAVINSTFLSILHQISTAHPQFSLMLCSSSVLKKK